MEGFLGVEHLDFRYESQLQKCLDLSDPTGFQLWLFIPTIPKSYSVDSENCIREAFGDPAFKRLICTMFC